MNRRMSALLVASAILVGAYAATPAQAHTSVGLSCAVTKTWYEGVTRTGVPRWGVAIRMTDKRSSPAWMRAGILASTGKVVYTRTKFVQASGFVDSVVTSPSATNQMLHCHG